MSENVERKQMYRLVEPDKDVKFEKEFKATKGPEEKQYLVCIRALARSSMPDEWEIVTGRSEAREMIINAMDYIDFERSFVLVESCTLLDRISIYAFMKHIEQFFADGFDIDDYVSGDWSEKDYAERNDIDSMYAANQGHGVSMEDIMNGGVHMAQLNKGRDGAIR